MISPLADERAVLLDAPRVRLHVGHESRHQVQKTLAEFARFEAGRLQLLSIPENKIATLTVLVTRLSSERDLQDLQTIKVLVYGKWKCFALLLKDGDPMKWTN